MVRPHESVFGTRPRRVRFLLVCVLLTLSLLWARHRFSDRGQWFHSPTQALKVAVVDYTVAEAEYKEHAGLFWLLNHHRVAAPTGETWRPADDYSGTYLDGREPTRIEDLELRGIDLLYVADTYGIYGPERESGRSKLLFGGLSEADAMAIDRFAAAGGDVVVEFNSFAEPTAAAPRRRVEDVLGVRWSGWVGRVIAKIDDPADSPGWLPDAFRASFPSRPMPEGPCLVLVHRSGRMAVFEGKDLLEVAPTVALEPAWQTSPPLDAAPYYYWFSLVHPAPGTEVVGRIRLPALTRMDAFLAGIGFQDIVPAATLRRDKGHRFYLAGDFSDIDFAPGPYRSAAAVADGRQNIVPAVMNGRAAFWNFVVPWFGRMLTTVDAPIEPRHCSWCPRDPG